MQSSSASVTQSFLLHTPGSPNVIDSNDVTFTNGDQELFMKTLSTAGSRSYSVSDEGASGSTDIYRLQDNYTGVADNVLLHALTTSAPGLDPVSVAITGQTSSTWTITFSSSTLGTATLVLNQGTFSLGGSFGYAASGTPQLSPLTSAIQSISVTSNGSAWGSIGASSNSISTNASTNIPLGTLSSVTDAATSTGSNTTSSLSPTVSDPGSSTLAKQANSSGTSQNVTQSTTLVNNQAVNASLPTSLLDTLSQDLILSKNKKTPVATRATSV
jgi:hypothetical protein